MRRPPDGVFPTGSTRRPTWRPSCGCGGGCRSAPGDGLRHPGRPGSGTAETARCPTRRPAISSSSATAASACCRSSGLAQAPFEFMARRVAEKPKGGRPRSRPRCARRARPAARHHRGRRARPSCTPAAATTGPPGRDGLHRRALRRQRPGHARHRAALFGTSPRRLPRRAATPPKAATSITCGRSTASAAAAASARRSSRACSPRGIMYECVRHGVPFLLAGSIRDDGPLPDVDHRRARGPAARCASTSAAWRSA